MSNDKSQFLNTPSHENQAGQHPIILDSMPVSLYYSIEMTIFKVAYCFFHVFPLYSQRLFLFYTAMHQQSFFEKSRWLLNVYSFFVASIGTKNRT